MRMRLYRLLVNKHLGIGQRYHRVHDNAGMIGRVISWIYLLWLNFAYTFLFCRFLGIGMETPTYEEKRLLIDETESVQKISPGMLAKKLQKYDVISFDIFDTLIYRPFSAPTDLFYLVGMELEYMDFARIRSEVENETRWSKFHKERSFEVTLKEIWVEIAKRTGLDAALGMETEIRLEKDLCYANPYMLEVYQNLKAMGKRIIYTSDMYLPSEVLTDILTHNGYEAESLFLSCELNLNKGSGELYHYIRESIGKDYHYIHLGDNELSDVKRARGAGFATYPVMNPNKRSVLFRAHDLSPVIGGAYRGIVNNRLYCGLKRYSLDYEFGFIYGGIFILGYCNFIHEFCRENGITKILFLSRDGEIVKKVYDRLYREKTEYAHISRLASSKLTAGYDRYDYIKKMVYHKVNRGFTLEEILKAMELDNLILDLLYVKKLHPTDKLVTENLKEFVKFLNQRWDEILKIYEPQRRAAGEYFATLIEDGDKVAAVDIGWAGTGAMAIRTMVRKEWKINAEVIGIVAGTNTPHNAEPFMSEGYLLDRKLVSYLFSSTSNRDLWKKHNPSAEYNLYFELLTSSQSASLKGYYPLRDSQTETGFRLAFQKREKNADGICKIQEGILDFVDDYMKHLGKYPSLLHISGRDAYAPMLVAASNHERYMKSIYKNFQLKVEV